MFKHFFDFLFRFSFILYKSSRQTIIKNDLNLLDKKKISLQTLLAQRTKKYIDINSKRSLLLIVLNDRQIKIFKILSRMSYRVPRVKCSCMQHLLNLTQLNQNPTYPRAQQERNSFISSWKLLNKWIFEVSRP